MGDSSSASGHRDDEPLHQSGHGTVASSRRLLRRPTLTETERIARGCPPEGLSLPALVQAIRRETGCSRATAYRAVADTFAAGILRWKENTAS
jgi:hypothetical protein